MLKALQPASVSPGVWLLHFSQTTAAIKGKKNNTLLLDLQQLLEFSASCCCLMDCWLLEEIDIRRSRPLNPCLRSSYVEIGTIETAEARAAPRCIVSWPWPGSSATPFSVMGSRRRVDRPGHAVSCSEASASAGWEQPRAGSSETTTADEPLRCSVGPSAFNLTSQLENIYDRVVPRVRPRRTPPSMRAIMTLKHVT